jgi:quinol monooxygenase YgiN
MGIKVVIESTVKKDVLEALLPFLENNLPKVRGFIGCLNVMVFLDHQSRKMIFDEEWLSIDAHQKYIHTITGNGVLEELVSFLESPPDITYLDRIEI